MSVFKLDNRIRWILLLEIAIPMTVLILGIYHGLLQTLYRAGIIHSTSFLGLEYYQGLTLHGVVNAIVLTTFFAVAFGNAVVTFSLRKSLNVSVQFLSFGLMMAGTLLAAGAILSGKATVLYTFYPPLMAHPTFYIGAVLLVVGSWVAFFNWIPLYTRWRKENPDKKTPMAVVGMFTTFIVWFICTLPVASEILLFLLPWSLGWVQEINIMLTRVLFWFFGHPLVYFWLLPVYTMFYAMLPKLAGGKLYSDYAGRLVFMLFIVFSIPVGLHHQFAEPGISQTLKLIHAILTFGVAVPSLLTAFTLAASLEYAGKKNGGTGLFGWLWKLPYFNRDRYLFPYLMMGLFIFIFGGFTGIINASYSMNNVIHNTAWIPGHFHLTVAGPVFLGILGMSLHMISRLTGKEVRFKGWNVAVPYLWTIGLFFMSSGLMIGGLIGEPRRTNLGMSYTDPDSPLYNAEWIITTFTAAIGGILLFSTAVIYFIVFFSTLFGKSTQEKGIDFPVSEAYHDEPKIALVKNFRPWVITAAIIIAFAYTPPIIEALNNTNNTADQYAPDNPIPISRDEIDE